MKRNTEKEKAFRARLRLALMSALVPLAVGCLDPGSGNFSSTGNLGTAGSATKIPGGAMAAQVVFTTNSTTGSFIAPTNAGTPAIPGQGLQVTRLFNPDGSSLAAAGPTDPNWPAWIRSIEIGITGPNSTYVLAPNPVPTYSSNPNCARFATAAEAPGGSNQAMCSFGSVALGATTSIPCGAPAGTFRVSEADCNFGNDANFKGVGIGNGAGADNVYIRANFNRAALGSKENILLIISYAASSFYPADPTPSDCFTNYNSVTMLPFILGAGPWFTAGGNLTPEACSDFAWKLFLHHGATEAAVQPFSAFVPPVYSYVSNNANKTGTPPSSTRQFIIPLSGDSGLTTVELSRIFSKLKSTDVNFMNACDPSGGHLTTGANSPLCAGIIFNTITFFRI